MEILFNELSLHGQFIDIDAFINNGLYPFLGVLSEMQKLSMTLLKKSDVWATMPIPDNSLYSIITHGTYRNTDEVRRLKSAIIELTRDPYWDNESKQINDINYVLEGVNINGSSPAEACERDKIVVSFISSSVSIDPLNIIRNELNVSLLNLTYSGALAELLWNNKSISFELYVKTRFYKGKLDFTKVDDKMGFAGIQSVDQSLFLSTFRKFEELSWDQILCDKGLDYKAYNGNIGSGYKHIKTDKFRASKKIRCHGYRDNDSFIVIGFETDHKLSDQG